MPASLHRLIQRESVTVLAKHSTGTDIHGSFFEGQSMPKQTHLVMSVFCVGLLHQWNIVSLLVTTSMIRAENKLWLEYLSTLLKERWGRGWWGTAVELLGLVTDTIQRLTQPTAIYNILWPHQYMFKRSWALSILSLPPPDSQASSQQGLQTIPAHTGSCRSVS